ncbi:MAG: hypothetical protein JNL09_01990 [Anaerolineales bacterium]|nr:hypothetical protein [Anaerolineales bacterium]
MKTLNSTFLSRNITASDVLVRLAVYPGEVYRLPEVGQRVRVVNGQAWLSAQGRDIVLGADEQIALNSSTEVALVSPLSEMPVVLEVLN